MFVSGGVMYVFFPLLFLILANNPIAQTLGREPHYCEPGSGAISMRSAFAHGYRHGYEEGYHMGNIDINMGRKPHTKLSQIHALSHYSSSFGPRKSFESGFQQGVRAGYMDGFAGRVFRGLDNLRLTAVALDQSPAAADPGNVYFDQGFSAGYDQGLDSVRNEGPQPEKVDISLISCSTASGKRIEEVVKGTFCDGYRRGFILGHADGIVLGPNAMVLASRK
ncbi:MAG TPA: hypothetical protein VI685_09970 [Candidatus Angelobacter sp.]